MIFEYNDYRAYLQHELSLRATKNPNYSLRAFAKKLRVAPSTLSEVLKAKRNISRELAQAIAGHLGLNEQESYYFYTLVELSDAKTKNLKNILRDRLKDLTPNPQSASLDLEKLKELSGWHYIPLMEMTNFRPRVSNSHEMARLLNLSLEEVETSLEKLVRLGFLTYDNEGHLQKTNRNFLMASEKPNEAIRTFHKHMLSKAQDSLQTQSNKEKFIGSETFAIDSKVFPEANSIIEKCFTQMIKLSSRSTTKDVVYHVGIQFFKLSQVASTEKNS